MRRLTIYMAGAMEFKRGSGMNWRHNLTSDLKKIFKDIVIQDPTQDEKEKTGMNAEQAKKKLNHWKKAGNVSAIKKMMYSVIKADIKAVDRSDFIIVYWDKDIPTYGTVGEIQHAYDKNIPIYFVCANPLSDLSSWIIGEYTLKFNNFDELLYFLDIEYFGR